jgi:hypothetical protein
VPDIRLTSQLLQDGYSADELQRLRRSGQLERVRRGAYAPPSPDGGPEDVHRRRTSAVLLQCTGDLVVSHVSAAVLHGLPVWWGSLDRVHLTRTRAGGGRVRAGLEVHTSVLPVSDVVELAGVRVTSPARTVVDLARTLPLEQAVAAGDAALRAGLPSDAVAEVLRGCHGWPGVGAARRVAALFDGHSESAGESASRVRMHEARLPPPVLQLEVVDGYGRLLQPGQDVEEVVYREKLREDAFRDLGWRVARWTWPDLHPGSVLVQRLRRAGV